MTKYVCLLSVLIVHVSVAAKETAMQQIEADYLQGKLSRPQAVAYELLAIGKPAELPLSYRSLELELTRNATRLKAEAFSLARLSSPSDHDLLQQVLQRPELPLSMTSSAGHFKIHYSNSGTDAATTEFIQETAVAFEYAWKIEVEQLGFNPPPVDNVDGPEVDVYILQYGDYGSTTPDQPVASTPQDDYTSWIEIDNDFSHTPTKGLNGMRVTAAHEFFHTIQFGYRSYQTTQNNSVFFYEATAAWMEDIVYDSINDYLNYLNSFFRSPEIPFTSANGSVEYGRAIFFHMLSQKYETAIMRSIWDEMKAAEPLDALNKVLIRQGNNLNVALAEFAAWNCHTAANADTVRFYTEGRLYPALTANKSFDLSSTLTISGTALPMSCHYYKVTSLAGLADIMVSPTFSDPYNTFYAVVWQNWTGNNLFEVLAGPTTKDLSGVAGNTPAWIIPIYTRTPYISGKDLSFSFALNLGQERNLSSQIVLAYPNPFRPSVDRKLTIAFQMQTSAQVSAFILTEQGSIVWSQSLGGCPKGWNKCEWDGKEMTGQYAAAGVYLFIIRTPSWQEMCKFAYVQ
jgi:hypothetical protein